MFSKLKKISIKLNSNKCEIYFADEFNSTFLNQYKNENALFVTDHNTKKLFLNILDSQNFYSFPAGELSKNIFTVQSILEKALEKNLTRNSVFFAAGGGVVCDLTAFCASVFKRGARLVLIPTSLLAMVDASIGGKTGFDFAGIKNSVGSFYTAEKIFICFDFLKSLSKNEMKSGLAEIIKMGMINDKKILKLLHENEMENFFTSTSQLKKIIYLSVRAKAKIIYKDFTEKNIRMFLNLGHTFAHGLETLTRFKMVSHGEAVAWGLAQELKLGLKLKLTNPEYAQKIFALLKKFNFQTEFYNTEILQRLNISESTFSKKIIQFMSNDKKNTDNRITFILQKNAGKNFVLRLNKNELWELIS